MNLLLVADYYYGADRYGGPATSKAGLAHAMARYGMNVQVIATTAGQPPSAGGCDMFLAYEDGLRVRLCAVSPVLRGWFYAPTMRRAIREAAPSADLIWLASIWGFSGVVTRLEAARAGIPYVIEPQGQLYDWAVGQKRLKKQAYWNMLANRGVSGARAILCSAEEEASQAAERFSEVPVHMVPHVVDRLAFRVARDPAVRRALPAGDSDAVLMLYLGRLHPNKGPDVAIEAHARLLDRRPEVHLLVAGTGKRRYVRALQDLARDCGNADRVHFLGLIPRQDVFGLLAAVDVLLMPSRVQENFGMAAAESLAVGTPVVGSTSVPVIRMAAENGLATAARCSPDEIGRALSEFLSVQTPRHVTCDRLRQFAETQFGEAAVVPRLELVLRAVLQDGRAAGGQGTLGAAAKREDA